MSKYYDERYGAEPFYWGKQPSSMARIFFKKFLPQDGQSLLDIGCGEGRDSIFFAQNGFQVKGFDASAEGIKKSLTRAEALNMSIDFFQADINEYRLQDSFDVIFSSGALHYIPQSLRDEILSNYKRFTNSAGINVHMIPIFKPFLPVDPQADQLERDWRSGEILTHYHDWKIEYFTEEILDDIRSGYKFPVNRLIASKPSA